MATETKRKAKMAEPIPVFQPGSIKAAVTFRKRMGELRRVRKPPKTPPSRAPEIAYFKRLQEVLASLRALLSELVIPAIPAIVADTPRELRIGVKQDAGEVLVDAMRGVRVAFAARAPLAEIAGTAASLAATKNLKEHQRVVGTVLGIRPELGEPWLADMISTFTRDNAQLIGKVSDDFLERAERRIGSMSREGARAEEIAKTLERDFIRKEGVEARVAKKRAKLIARDQIASLQGDISRVRQQSVGVERYVWRTSQDERVRGSHREREGEVFEWGAPIGPQLKAKGLKVDTIDGPPGKPINCRCYAEPVLSDLVEDAPEI